VGNDDGINGKTVAAGPPMMQLFFPIDSNLQVTDLANEVSVALVVISGKEKVVMQIATPQGVQFYFMGVDAAKFIGNRLGELTSKILIAPAAAIPPMKVR
jgi:hypothetical protein